jgi:ribonucleoside-diphosphate reductase subunit M1
MEMPDHNKLASAHIYAWKNGLKTGSYYIRSQPITEATKFSIDIEQINSIKNKRNVCSLNDRTCESCSA